MTVVKLQGLNRARTYEVEDLDTGRKRLVSGQDLAAGLRVELANPQSSALLIYRDAK